MVETQTAARSVNDVDSEAARNGFRFTQWRPGDPGCRSGQDLIRDRFREKYGASNYPVPEVLLGICDPTGRPCATAGISLAAEGPLFAEQYLPIPIERWIAARVDPAVFRHEVAEVGALSSCEPGVGALIATLCVAWLEARGIRWAVVTATREVRSLLSRIGIRGTEIAEAKSSCLQSTSEDWGSYYACDPRVLLVSFKQASRARASLGARYGTLWSEAWASGALARAMEDRAQ
jgi:hypothetical protein